MKKFSKKLVGKPFREKQQRQVGQQDRVAEKQKGGNIRMDGGKRRDALR